jgi:carboxyl-terminal processing protease
LTVPIVRASIRVDYLSTSMLLDNIGYIKLRGFPEPSVADRFERFLDQVLVSDARGLVIDLRGNAGGRVDIGTRLLNRFVSSGPLYQQADRNGRRQVQIAAGPGLQQPLPIEILIDEGTASMGEIFASAMKEHGLATLIGKQTSGNVAAAQVYPLLDGSAVQVTVLEILSGNGQTLNRVGVAPDQVFEMTPAALDAGRDPALEAAIVDIWNKTPDYTARP